MSIAEVAFKAKGYKKLFLPIQNAPQTSLISDIKIYGVSSLKDMLLHLKIEFEKSPYNSLSKKLSGPLLDRIDLSINLVRVANDTILDHKSLIYLQHINALKLI